MLSSHRIGDVLDAFMAMMVLRTCQKVEGGLPADVKAKMMFNIIIDFIAGLVPVLGDLMDAIFRANTKNAAELEKYLRKKGAANLKAQGAAVPAIDPSDALEYDRMLSAEPGTPPEYTTDTPTQQPPMRQNPPAQATSGPQPSTTTQKSGGGLFSGFRKKTKEPDMETGITYRPEDQPLPSLPAQESAPNSSDLEKTRANRPTR